MQILEVFMLSDDLKKTEIFYSGKLGLKVINKKQFAVSFVAGRSVLTFLQSKNTNPVYHFAFNIPNNKFSQAITWASMKFNLLNIENGDVIADFKSWNARSFYFFDNNGNILEFIARFDLDNASDQPFSSSSILSISEIGVVTENVTGLVKDLVEEYKIPVFSKQPVLSNFAALGNDKGLLILSVKNRHWYPTECPARKFYTKIKLLINRTNVEITVNNKWDW